MYILKIKFRGNDKIYKVKCDYMYREKDYIYLSIGNNCIEINWNNVDFYTREEIGE